MTIGKTLFASFLAIVVSLSFFSVSHAALDTNIWHEKFSSYVELVFNDGRNILVKGVNKYLNFGTTSGSSGYGIRDNGGSMEFKNSGGAWAGLGTGGGSGEWATTTADYWKTQSNFFSTTSAIYFVDASTTIPKTYAANTWTVLQGFVAGLLSSASSTIGNGTQVGGLTVSGGATTTGNAYVGGVLSTGSSTVMVNGVGLYVPTAEGVNMSKENIITTFQSGHGWVKTYPGGTLTDDTSDFIVGTQSLHLNAPANTVVNARKTSISPALDLGNSSLRLFIKYSDGVNLNGSSLFVSSDNFSTSYYSCNLKNLVTRGASSNVWLPVTFNPSDSTTGCTKTGAPNMSGINAFQITASSTAEIDIHVNKVSSFNNGTIGGKVTLTFDDGFESHYTQAAKYMAKYGMRGTAYVIPSIVGASGYANLGEFTEMQNTFGWDISAHALGSLVGRPTTSLESEFSYVKNYLIGNGFSKGVNDFAYPNGAYDETTVIPIVKKYFRSARTIDEYPETFPPYDPHKLRVYSITNADATTTVQAAIYNAAANNEWLIFVFHNITTSMGSNDINPLKFQAIIDTIAASGISVNTVSEVLNTTDWSSIKMVNNMVSIGTTTPYSRFSVWGRGTTTGETFSLTNAASTTLFSVLDSGTSYFLGNVGIGTTSPYAKLSVVGPVVAQYFHATDTSATSTFQKTSITGAVSILGEYMTNFTTYVRSLFSAANASLTYSAGAFSINLANRNDWSVHQTFSSLFATAASTTNATTTNMFVTSGATAAGAFVAFDSIGRLIATTTPTGSSSFSTTSAIYFVDASTTIPKTYTANTWTALQTFSYASSTGWTSSYASSTSAFFGSLSVGSLSGIIKATAGALSSAVASDIVALFSGCSGIQYLGADGACHTDQSASGSGVGTVSTSSTPTIGNLAYWTGTGWPSTLGTVSTGTVAGSGGVTVTAGQYIIGSGLTVGCTTASGAATGCLSSADWTTFNNKQATLTHSYPLVNTANTISLAFGTTTANSWSALQTFNGGVAIGGWNVATSVEMCRLPDHCTYQADGTADQVQYMAAIDYLKANGGGSVHVKAGTYNFSAEGKAWDADNVMVYGDGPGTIFKPTTSGFKTLSASSSDNFTFRDFAIDGVSQSGSAFNGDMGIVLRASRNTLVTGVSAYNMGGFAVFVDSRGWYVGGAASSSDSTRIIGNYFQGRSLQDVVGGGPDEDSYGTATSSEIIVSMNNIEQRGSVGMTQHSNADFNCLDIVAQQNVIISNNTCYGNIVLGSEQNAHEYVNVSNNVVNKVKGAVDVAGDIVVITGGTTYGVMPKNLTISGNVVRYGKINVSGASSNVNEHVLISGNNITAASSTAQNYNFVGHQCIYTDTMTNSSIRDNDCTAAPSTIASTETCIYSTNTANTAYTHNSCTNFRDGIRLSNNTGNSVESNDFYGVTNRITGTLSGVGIFQRVGDFFGFGTSTPYAKLSVWGNSTGNIFEVVTSASTSAMWVSSVGQIIGTAFGTGYTGVISPSRYISSSIATSTAWTATTTGNHIKCVIAPFAGTIRRANIGTDTGTLSVDIYHTSTHAPLITGASSTIASMAITSNNTFTKNERICVSAGTPASTPTRLDFSLEVTETSQ